MREKFRVYIHLLLIYLGLAFVGFFITKYSDIPLLFIELSILLTGALIISIIATSIFLRGFGADKSKNAIATLLAIVLKFLLFIALIGIYALIFKDLSLTFIVTFFIIYLAYTSYLLITFVRILKSTNEFKPDVKEEQA